MGFGRSDKPTDIHWYTIARHTEMLNSLIVDLGLNDITLVCQDWGGPTGLAQAAMMPERFGHLVIMNTWLHHPGYEYTPSIAQWIADWHEGGRFHRSKPNLGLMMALTAGLVSPDVFFSALEAGTEPELSGDTAAMCKAYSAPFRGLPDEGHNGARRFPLSIPLDSYANGNAAAQTMHYRALLDWDKGCHFIWGVRDVMFTEAWGRQWAGQMNARFDSLDAGHFLQNTHGQQLAELILDGRNQRA